MATPQELWKRYEALKSQRSPYEADWRDCALYILPRKGSAIGRPPVPGEKQTTRLFDSTAIDANGKLAQAIQGSLTSPATRWFRLKMRDEAMNEDPEIAAWLDDTANRAYAAIQQSNWDAEILEVYHDLGAFGTAAMLVQERDDLALPTFQGMRFESIPIGTYVIAEDALGRVNTLYRVYEMSAEAAVGRWGKDAVGEKLREKAEKKPTDRVEILHAVYPRIGGKPGGRAIQKPYASCYLAVLDKHVIKESGFERFPFVVPRWTKASGEVYGRGPGHVALPDIRTLNKMTELELRSIAKAIDPPMAVKDHGVIGAVRLTPGAVTVTRDLPEKTLIPIQSGANFQIGQIKSQELKAAIRDMFFNSQLTFPTNQPMTATEIERRYEIMHRVLGPTSGRIQYEATAPTAEMTVQAMWRGGALLPAPPQLIAALESGAGDIDIVAEGPLVRAQKGSDVLAIERWFVLMAPMAEHQPAIMDNINFDAAARVVADATGVPPKVVNTPDRVAELRDQRAKAEEEQKQMTQLSELGKGARNVAPLLKAVAPQGMAAPPPQEPRAPVAA